MEQDWGWAFETCIYFRVVGVGVGIELKPFPWVGMDTFLNTHKRQSGPLKKNLVGSINYLKMDDFIT